jgi:hypothetical protein
MEENVRSLRKNDAGRWREMMKWRVRFTEPKEPSHVSDPKSGLMLLGERVADATTT